MSGLTLAQKGMLEDIDDSGDVYVFAKGDDSYTFSYYKDNTCARVYTTITAKALIRKGVCHIRLCDVEDSLENCVGVLERSVPFEKSDLGGDV